MFKLRSVVDLDLTEGKEGGITTHYYLIADGQEPLQISRLDVQALKSERAQEVARTVRAMESYSIAAPSAMSNVPLRGVVGG